jgi:hypothetical protein
MTAAPLKPKRRWYQFSLRTLIVFMLLASVGLGWVGIKIERARSLAQRKQQIIAEISSLGGKASFIGLPDDVTQISVDYPGRDLAPLVKCLKLRMKNLDLLVLTIPQASDLSPLVELKSLTELTLIDNSQVKDLTSLTSMKSLRILYIQNPDGNIFSETQEDDLRRAMRPCEVTFGHI